MTRCQAEKTFRHDIFSTVGGVVRQGVETTVRERVTALFRSRGLSQRELADALGVDPSWVSAFLKGTRHANDLPLLVRLARYFGVSVGYLLNEADRGRDAGAATLLATWDQLEGPDRDVVLQLALSLRRRSDGASAPAFDGPAAERAEAAQRSSGAPGKARAKKGS